MPRRVRKEVYLGHRRVRAPAGVRIRKKGNKGGGVICAPRAQHWRVTLFNIFS